MKSFEALKHYFIDSLKNQYNLRELNSFFYILLENLKGWNKLEFSLQKKMPANENDEFFFQEAISKLKFHTPIQYVTNLVDFQDLKLTVNENVLIPRPETEELVSLVQSNCQNNPPKNILDIGTGSGCIILALRKFFKNSKCLGIDISFNAVEVAKKNAKDLDLDVNFLVADIFKIKIKQKFDIIVSNPPYITYKEKEFMDSNVLEHEPHNALFVDNFQPLIFYRIIAEFAKDKLCNNGTIYFEINELYGDEVVSLLEDLGYVNCILKKDLQGKNRFVYGSL
jgi:release factor glutamine methyltransferase